MTLSTTTPWAEASMRRLTKPGPATSADAMPSVRQRLGQPAGQLARVDADLLAELKRQVGGVVAVLGVARTLDGDRLRQRGRVEAVLGQHRGGGGLEQLGQVGGGHEGPSYGLGWSGPESISDRSRCVSLCTPNGAAFQRRAPVAQGIERLPPEQKAAGSNPAGGTTLTWQNAVSRGALPIFYLSARRLRGPDSLAVGRSPAPAQFAS